MATRRHMLSADLAGYSHRSTPRKQRTFNYTDVFFFQDGGLWNKSRHYRPQPQSPQLQWIGKYFIPMGSQPFHPDKANYVLEHEIAKYAQPFIYQVLWTDAEGRLRSQPEDRWRPGRLNVYVNAQTGIIQDVEYF